LTILGKENQVPESLAVISGSPSSSLAKAPTTVHQSDTFRSTSSVPNPDDTATVSVSNVLDVASLELPMHPATFVDELLETLYDFVETEPNEHSVANVNALLGLPESRFPPCYPGESPTVDSKCPVCSIPCS
jgi:hypothetical protein